MELKEALVKLAWLRLDKESAKAAADKALDKLMQTPEGKLWRELNDKAVEYGKLVVAAETNACELALGTFQVTGDKNPEAGVAIKLFKRIKYDAGQVLAWCEEHAPIFVKRVLDTKAFEKAVEGMIYSDVPCTIKYEPRPQISADLSGYLAPETTKE